MLKLDITTYIAVICFRGVYRVLIYTSVDFVEMVLQIEVPTLI